VTEHLELNFGWGMLTLLANDALVSSAEFFSGRVNLHVGGWVTGVHKFDRGSSGLCGL